MSKFYKFMLGAGLFAAVGNVAFSIVESNYYAMMAWIAALCWFPYDMLFALGRENE